MAESHAHPTAGAVRNIALVGHAHSGKTTLTEELLALAGATRNAGSIEKGNTVSDFTDQEKRAGHSLDVAVCHLEHDGARINLLDTPGYPDFVGKTLAVLPAVETVAVVINDNLLILRRRPISASAFLSWPAFIQILIFIT